MTDRQYTLDVAHYHVRAALSKAREIAAQSRRPEDQQLVADLIGARLSVHDALRLAVKP